MPPEESTPLPGHVSPLERAIDTVEAEKLLTTPTTAGAHTQVVINDASDRDSITASLRELWHHRLLIRELAQRDLKLRYKNSVAGIAWSLLNPILLIFVITMMLKFSRIQIIEGYSAYLFGIIFLWGAFQNA